MKLNIFTPDFITQLIVMGASALLLWLGWVVKKVVDRYNFDKHIKKEKEAIHGFTAISNIYAAMDNIKRLEAIGRVSLVSVSNGGDVPVAGSVIYGRLVDIKVPDITDYKEREYFLQKYKQFRVDGQYINMVLEAIRTKKLISFKEKDLSPCFLKNVLLEENIEGVMFHHLFSDVNKWKQYILVIEGVNLTEEEKAIVINNINFIKLNFKNSHS
jgi:hypothetical protein